MALPTKPRDYPKLQHDRDTHPALAYVGKSISTEQLAEHLRKCHARLMSPLGGPYGYLYQQQLQIIKELKDELRKRQTDRR